MKKKQQRKKEETNPKKPIGRSFSQILATKYEYKNYQFFLKNILLYFGVPYLNPCENKKSDDSP